MLGWVPADLQGVHAKPKPALCRVAFKAHGLLDQSPRFVFRPF
jgi:hypothetical protein